jgi:hypothetical protein
MINVAPVVLNELTDCRQFMDNNMEFKHCKFLYEKKMNVFLFPVYYLTAPVSLMTGLPISLIPCGND